MNCFVPNKYFLLFLLSFILVRGFSQTQFEKGFYIDNNGIKIEGLIKNEDWLNDPDKVVFKTDENQNELSLSIDQVAFFEVGDYKFKRYDILYDLNYNENSAPSYDIKPNYKSRKAFLHLLVGGSASLYKLGSQKRFYFTVKDDSIRHLVYLRYNKDGRIRTNESYKSQLFDQLQCHSLTIEDINTLSFDTKKLMKLFSNYNECVGEQEYLFEKKKKAIFHLSPLVGGRLANVKQRNDFNQSQNVDFPKKWNPVFGLNIEYILPFNNYKWSVYFESIYQSYKSELDLQTYRGTVDYKSVELYLGVRYYFYLNNKSTLFLNSSLMGMDIPFDSKIGAYEVKSVINLTLGGGYLYNEKISIAARIASPRELMQYYAYYFTKYQSIEFVIAYRIF